MGESCKILKLSKEEQEEVLAFLDDGIITKTEAEMLDNIFSGQIEDYDIEEE